MNNPSKHAARDTEFHTDFYIAPTAVGTGVFTRNGFTAGSRIWALSGERADVKEITRRIFENDERLDDPLQVGVRTYLDIDEPSRTFNHSCDPNSGLRRNAQLFAIRDIKPGEEVRYDYSVTIGPTVWSMKCACGAARCRKEIGDVRSIPEDQVDFYLEKRAVQPWMIGVIKRLRSGTYTLPRYEIDALKCLGLLQE